MERNWKLERIDDEDGSTRYEVQDYSEQKINNNDLFVNSDLFIFEGINAQKYANIFMDTLKEKWLPIESAPTDGTEVLVYAAPIHGLKGFVTSARYHKDAGWCVDELRPVILWQPLPEPPVITKGSV